MTTCRPSSLRFRVLAVIIANPSEMAVADIARHLFPPPRMPWPSPSLPVADRLAVVRGHAIHVAEEHGRACARVSNAVESLQKDGLVAPCGPPAPAAWFVERVSRFGVAHALERAHPLWPRPLAAGLGSHVAIYSRLTGKRPPSVAALLGPSPSGAQRRAWRELVAWGCVVGPRSRVPTMAGIALVVGGGA